MPEQPQNPIPAVAAPSTPPYTDSMRREALSGAVPWWREAVRAWVPVLGFAVLFVFEMMSLQQQIGELRTDLHGEIGDLRSDMQNQIGDLRSDMQQEIGDLRSDMQQEMGNLRDELRSEIGALGQRIARLEALMGSRADPDGSRPGR